MRPWADFYWTSMKTAIAGQFQYRVANYFWMIGMVAEPVIYLIVWSTVAASRGGSVGGFTPAEFAAYYIVWTLVRNMNIVFTPYGWEWRIRQGELSAMLVRPVHVLHYDVAYFAGWKVVIIVLWLPIAVILSAFFHPAFDITPLEVVVFFFAIWGAYLIRSMWQSALGAITFWTVRVSAIFELYFAAELLLSGRLVPIALLPPWAQRIADFLPFRWSFGFPIEALAGESTPEQLLAGLGMQALWIASGIAVVSIVWRFAVRHYTAVGG